MTLQHWDPFARWRTFDPHPARLWHGFSAPSRGATRAAGWAIPIDVVDDEAGLTVRASLPGIGPADVKVEIEDGILTIAAETKTGEEVAESGYLRRERRSGSFHRALRLPDTIDQGDVTSVYANGALTISLPKSEATKPRKVEVRVN